VAYPSGEHEVIEETDDDLIDQGDLSIDPDASQDADGYDGDSANAGPWDPV
jgi:hypothetical protein